MFDVGVESDRWLDLLGQLFGRAPLPDAAAGSIAQQLARSLNADAAGLHWRTPSGVCGLRQWPEILPQAFVEEYLGTPHLLFSDPLWRWFDITQDPTPSTQARALTRIPPSPTFSALCEVTRPMGIEHRMSIPIELGRGEHVAIILSRRGCDFSTPEVNFASRLRPALQALNRQSGVLNSLPADVLGAARDHGLTAREISVMSLLAQGYTASSIGRRLNISERTVHKHLQHAYTKLGARDRLTAVERARCAGVLPVGPPVAAPGG